MSVQTNGSGPPPLIAQGSVSYMMFDNDGIDDHNKDFEVYFTCLTDQHRATLEKMTSNLFFRLGIIILIVVDAIVLLVELTNDVDEDAVNGFTIFILILLTIELLLQLLWRDLIPFFTNPWMVLDFIITIVSFIGIGLENAVASFAVLLRLVRVLRRLLRLCRVARNVAKEKTAAPKAIRQVVSADRRRYMLNGFDLDITYITDRVLAMSVPAEKTEAIYRNPAPEVARFFNTLHADHYMLFNLVPERKYDYTPFHNRVIEHYMPDHNPCALGRILQICQEVDKYLESDPDNVVAIHCKGGKGRTGTIIVSYNLYRGKFATPDESLKFFGQRRTSEGGNFQGVESPSQDRFIRYFFEICRGGKASASLPPSHSRPLSHIRLYGTSKLPCQDIRDMWFKVLDVSSYPETVVYDQREDAGASMPLINVDEKNGFVDFLPTAGLLMVTNDVKICFYSPQHKKGEKNVFLFWFHCYFERNNNPIRLEYAQIDGPHKSKNKAMFADDFALEIYFHASAAGGETTVSSTDIKMNIN